MILFRPGFNRSLVLPFGAVVEGDFRAGLDCFNGVQIEPHEIGIGPIRVIDEP